MIFRSMLYFLVALIGGPLLPEISHSSVHSQIPTPVEPPPAMRNYVSPEVYCGSLITVFRQPNTFFRFNWQIDPKVSLVAHSLKRLMESDFEFLDQLPHDAKVFVKYFGSSQSDGRFFLPESELLRTPNGDTIYSNFQSTDNQLLAAARLNSKNPQDFYQLDIEYPLHLYISKPFEVGQNGDPLREVKQTLHETTKKVRLSLDVPRGKVRSIVIDHAVAELEFIFEDPKNGQLFVATNKHQIRDSELAQVLSRENPDVPVRIRTHFPNAYMYVNEFLNGSKVALHTEGTAKEIVSRKTDFRYSLHKVHP